MDVNDPPAVYMWSGVKQAVTSHRMQCGRAATTWYHRPMDGWMDMRQPLCWLDGWAPDCQVNEGAEPRSVGGESAPRVWIWVDARRVNKRGGGRSRWRRSAVVVPSVNERERGLLVLPCSQGYVRAIIMSIKWNEWKSVGARLVALSKCTGNVGYILWSICLLIGAYART